MSILLDALKSAEKKRLDTENGLSTEAETLPLVGDQDDAQRHKLISEKASYLSLESKESDASIINSYQSPHAESRDDKHKQTDIELESNDYGQPNVSDSIIDRPSIEKNDPILSTKSTVTKTYISNRNDNSLLKKNEGVVNESAISLRKTQANIAIEPESQDKNTNKKVLPNKNSPESAAEIFIAKLPKPKPSYYNTKYFIILLLILSSVTISGYFIYELSIKPFNNKSDFRDLLNSNIATEKIVTDISQTNDSSSILNTEKFSHKDSIVEPSVAANLSLQNEEISTTTVNLDETIYTVKEKNNAELGNDSIDLQKESITATQETKLDTKNSDFQDTVKEERQTSQETTNNSLAGTSKSSENINTNVGKIDLPSNKKVIDHGNGIIITRNFKTDHQTNLLTNAYRMYEERNYSAAKNQYAEILQTQPNNYDALLGFATTTQALGDNKLAEQYYNILIDRYPRDTYSQAGLLSLLGSYDFSARTSKIKSFIKSSPNTAYFHFLLGENYAKNHLWGDAQAALFDAVRLDKNNPDYNFNLAVSLDQLNKHDVALNYYQNAISLASTRPANFDLNQARIRAGQLQVLRN